MWEAAHAAFMETIEPIEMRTFQRTGFDTHCRGLKAPQLKFMDTISWKTWRTTARRWKPLSTMGTKENSWEDIMRYEQQFVGLLLKKLSNIYRNKETKKLLAPHTWWVTALPGTYLTVTPKCDDSGSTKSPVQNAPFTKAKNRFSHSYLHAHCKEYKWKCTPNPRMCEKAEPCDSPQAAMLLL